MSVPFKTFLDAYDIYKRQREDQNKMNQATHINKSARKRFIQSMGLFIFYVSICSPHDTYGLIQQYFTILVVPISLNETAINLLIGQLISVDV